MANVEKLVPSKLKPYTLTDVMNFIEKEKDRLRKENNPLYFHFDTVEQFLIGKTGYLPF